MKHVMQRIDPARLLMRRVRLLIMIAIVVIAVPGVHHLYLKERESNAFNLKAQVELADLQNRSEKLKADVRTFSSDRGREAALREQYAMGKDGEGLIVIINSTSASPIAASSSVALKTWINRVFPWWK